VNFDLIIVRYGEIALKGKQIRRRFEDTLISNIKNVFKQENLKVRFKKEWGRIYIYSANISECLKILQKTFGIISISPAFKTISDINKISKIAVDISKEKINENKSFAVRATRTGNHDFSSQDVSIRLGNDIIKKTKASVNLSNPEFILYVEIRDKNSYIFTEKIFCVGGLPLGTQGSIITLIDSYSSILAAWYLMKRGCKITFLIKNKAYESTLRNFLKKWYIKPNIQITNKKESLSKIIGQDFFDAVVTNHSLFEKDENTLKEMKQIKKDIKIPILSPLISMTKDEINSNCKKIGLPV